MRARSLGGWNPVTSRIALLGVFVSALAWAESPQMAQARKLYSLTEYDRALQILQAIPDKDAATHHLMGVSYYGRGDFKKSTDSLEKALAADPNNSSYALWLGRAYGRRAETSNLLTAPGYASKARQYFEKAVALNPNNLEALNDLFEYYLQAPGFLGGGFDKAVTVSERIGALNAVEGHWAAARLAEKRKEFSRAEEQLRRAAEMAPQQVGRLIDLAHFLSKQGRFQDADSSLAKAEKIAPNSPKVMYAKAEMYIKNGRNLPQARTLLKRYLASTLSPDDPPRSEAEKLLRQAEGG
jgi:tetratricopeptide (TPR) repeat protein